MVTPRKYQSDATGNARTALNATGRALVVIASGLGKTLTSAFIWHGFRKGRGLFLVHSNDILDHALEEYQKVWKDGETLAILKRNRQETFEADIVFATFQSMYEILEQFPRDYFAWATVDESHHSQARTYHEIINHFDCPKLGITATPDRMDLRDIREIFGPEVYDLPLEKAIAEGILPTIEYHLLTDEGFDQSELERLAYEVISDGRRVSLSQINSRIFIPARDVRVAEIIEAYDEQTVIFCKSIDHATNFKPFLESADTYHSARFLDDKRSVMARFRNEELRRVLAVNCFNEGVDFPDVGLVVFYRVTQSETVFKQQLGRGLHSGKKKLVVLDFVGSIERLRLLKRMTQRIRTYQEPKEVQTLPWEIEREWQRGDVFHLSGRNMDFVFSDEILGLMSILNRLEKDFYLTWQEAGNAARAIGITSQKEYYKKYRGDPKLPSNPRQYYEDFPKWARFLGTDPYPTWQEASNASVSLGIRFPSEYRKRYKEDERLPSSPNKQYSDFPGWRVFLGRQARDFYPTWQEAAIAARQLGLTNQREYFEGYAQDPRLSSMPNRFYANFPGYGKFLAQPVSLE